MNTLPLQDIFDALKSGIKFKKYSHLKAVVPRKGYNYIYSISEYRAEGNSFKIIAQFTYDAHNVEFVFDKYSLWYKQQRYEREEWYDKIQPYIFLETKIDDCLFLPYMTTINEMEQLLEYTQSKQIQWEEQNERFTITNPIWTWMEEYIISPIGFHNRYGDFLYQTFITYNHMQNLAAKDVDMIISIYDSVWDMTMGVPQLTVESMELDLEQIVFPSCIPPYPFDYNKSITGQASIIRSADTVSARMNITSDQPISEMEKKRLGDWIHDELVQSIKAPIKINVRLNHQYRRNTVINSVDLLDDDLLEDDWIDDDELLWEE